MKDEYLDLYPKRSVSDFEEETSASVVDENDEEDESSTSLTVPRKKRALGDRTDEESDVLIERTTTHPVGERACGIVSFLGDPVCISAQIKERFSDFVVNEIDTDGNVVHLNDLSTIPKMGEETEIHDGEFGKPDVKESLRLLLRDVLDADTTDHSADIDFYVESFLSFTRHRMMDGTECGSTEDENSCADIAHGHQQGATEFIFPPILDKSNRTRVHQFVREYFPGFQSGTVSLDEEKTTGGSGNVTQIVVRFAPSTRAGSDQRKQSIRGRENRRGGKSKFEGAFRGDSWPRNCPLYCLFHLLKQNRDTMNTLHLIGRALHVSPKVFNVAGTKDKRGITIQRITARRVEASKIFRLNSDPRFSGWLKVGDFRYVDNHLKLGGLKGNRFRLVLRDLRGKYSDIESSISSLRSRGFVNYFGLQRFGTTSVPNSDIGRALLRHDFETAIKLILAEHVPGFGAREDESNPARIRFSRFDDVQGALDLMPKKCISERIILSFLVEQPMQFQQAFFRIPRTTRLLFLHSYQSLIFNLLCTRRVELFGQNISIGDLVLADLVDDSSFLTEEVEEDCSTSAVQQEDTSQLDSKSVEQLPKVIVINEQNIHDYSFRDLVLPVPGFGVEIPKNEVGVYLTQLLARDGFDLDYFQTHCREASLIGGYRRVFVVPSDVEYDYLQYSNPFEDLNFSDLNHIESMPDPANYPDHILSSPSAVDELLSEIHVQNPSDHGKKCALRIEFSLPASSYATMCMRQLLFQPTDGT